MTTLPRIIPVIPAKAGIQNRLFGFLPALWIPASAGMTVEEELDSRLRGNDG